MSKLSSEPGPYIPLKDVEEVLKKSVYGVQELVDIGLFYTDHLARHAMDSGKIKFHKINKRAVVLCREDILEYWFKFRSKPFEDVNNSVKINLTISEVDYVTALVAAGKKKVDAKFSVSDLFRNILREVKKLDLSQDQFDLLYATNP